MSNTLLVARQGRRAASSVNLFDLASIYLIPLTTHACVRVGHEKLIQTVVHNLGRVCVEVVVHNLGTWSNLREGEKIRMGAISGL